MRTIIFGVLLVISISCSEEKDNIESRINMPPVAEGSGESSLVATDQGLILSWIEKNEAEAQLKMSNYDGEAWSIPTTIAQGDDWFVNWADFPAIVANGDALFTHFLQKSAASTYAYDVMYSVSQDMGGKWSNPKKLHQDTVAAEHGFVSAVPYKDGFYVSWLDGRNTVVDNGFMSIRGAFMSTDGTMSNSAEIDGSVCDCCQTSMAIVNDVPWSFYRDRSDDEIRDIYAAKLIDNTWTAPQEINNDNWLIKGCPVNGPRAITYNNTLVVSWYTGVDGENNVKMKISEDGGASFSEVILVDGPTTLGRVDIQMDADNIYLSYLTKNDDGSTINLKIYSHKGDQMGSEIIATVNPSRGTGFPRTALWQGNLVFTWTDIDNKYVKVLSYALEENNLQAGIGL